MRIVRPVGPVGLEWWRARWSGCAEVTAEGHEVDERVGRQARRRADPIPHLLARHQLDALDRDGPPRADLRADRIAAGGLGARGAPPRPGCPVLRWWGRPG